VTRHEIVTRGQQTSGNGRNWREPMDPSRLGAAMQGSHRRHRTSSALVSAGLVVLVAIVLSACSSDDPKYRPGTLPPLSPSASPSGSPSPTPSASATQGLSDREQVRAVYLDFITHYPAVQTQPRDRRQQFLSTWMVDPALSAMKRSIDRQVSNHERVDGLAIPHIMSIRVTRSNAVVNDCADQSRVHTVDTRTGRSIDKSASPTTWLVTWLKRTNAGWRVDRLGYRDKSCVPD
jgi:hypothetical protein